MGGLFGKAWKSLFEQKQVRMILVGLDAVGKTTIMYQIKINETVKTIPTIGFNVETMEYKGLKMTMWDLGGQDKIRQLWKHYYEGTDAIIYVVDSSDAERVEEANEELQKMLQEPTMEKAPLLVYANKQDIKGALTPTEISDKFGLTSLKNRKWLVQGCSAVKAEGLTEGLDWMAGVLNKIK